MIRLLLDARRRQSSQAGFTVLETVVVVVIVAILLAASVVAVRGYLGTPTLTGSSEVIMNDIRAAQQLSIARRANASITFTSISQGGAPCPPPSTGVCAVYAVNLGGANVRRDTLPRNLDFSSISLSGPLQFGHLGLPIGPSTSGASITILDSTSGNSVTITVNGVTGTVTTQ